MYYEINVAKKVKKAGIGERYEHYFATAPRSITYYENALKMLKEFQILFPYPEYEISIHENPERFTSYSPQEFYKKFEKKNIIESTLNNLNFNTAEKELICSIINRFGSSDHPYADDKTFEYFTISYLKEILSKKKFKNSINSLSEIGKKILTEIQIKLT